MRDQTLKKIRTLHFPERTSSSLLATHEEQVRLREDRRGSVANATKDEYMDLVHTMIDENQRHPNLLEPIFPRQ